MSPSLSPIGFGQSGHVLCQYIVLQMDAVSGSEPGESGDLPRMRDQHHLEPAGSRSHDREADSVDGNRALLHDVETRLARVLDLQDVVSFPRTRFQDPADLVDVP